MFFTVFVIAILLDKIIGEFPNNIHPVVLIGKVIELLKIFLIDMNLYISGLLLFLGVFIIFFILNYALYQVVMYLPIFFVVVISGIFFSQAFSIKFLLDSAERIRYILDQKDIKTGRREVSKIVSRPTENLQRPQLISATIETLTENITDSVVAPIFYYFAFGLIVISVFCYYHLFDDAFIVTNLNIFVVNNFGMDANSNVIDIIFISVIFVYAYRVINTMDAMVGYKNGRYKKLGFIPAIVDDIVNLIPARISGYLMIFASYILGMNWKNAYRILKRDARNCDSPNSGYPMAACAGALGIQLEKKNNYVMGDPYKGLDTYDIRRAYNLSRWTIFLYLLLQIFLTALLFIIISFLF
ncbi:cobalamin biosynthesis protein [uncultured Methanobrevibacter sp.]|uniref:cobalamin biosynthesis protein n=1 Tax=uncultured Methanobrevibacter sp. TaxID=253161 RepID=UPI0025E23812|nr:cobalamin biosynthesis protein [uncultured Methanobrevibacter sp.]